VAAHDYDLLGTQALAPAPRPIAAIALLGHLEHDRPSK
jgi:hypothetical protein